MAEETLSVPPFPPLKWDDYFWVGEIVLPSWAGFQTRRGPYASVSSSESSNGSVRLTVTPLDDRSRSHPTQEQLTAFRYLMDHESEVAEAVGRALIEYYPGEKDTYFAAYDDDALELPDVADREDLRPLIGLSNIHILSVAHSGAAYIGFEFGCVWDDEHGAGVMTHLGRAISTGQADVSFMAWIAKSDPERK